MKNTSTRVFPKAQKVLEGLSQIDQNRLPDGLKAGDLQKKFDAAKKVDNARIDALAKYRTLVDQATKERNELDDLLVRLRSTVKGIFGADSTEYQSVGGKRRSEHKRPTRGE